MDRSALKQTGDSIARPRHRIPFGIRPDESLSLGITLSVVGLLVILPLAAVALQARQAGLQGILRSLTEPAALAALEFSFVGAIGTALVNMLTGTVVAWALVRYEFKGRSIANAVVDLPFALPTAVAGITLSELFGPKGWMGALGSNLAGALHVPAASLAWLDMRYSYTPVGVLIAMTFVSLPFTVRAVQPVLASLEHDVEEAARSLGAHSWQVFRHVVLPSIGPAMLAGLALSFARSMGEFGSVVIISGNIPMRTLTGPVLIFQRLEQYDPGGATAIAVVMLAASLVVLAAIQFLRAKAAGSRG